MIYDKLVNAEKYRGLSSSLDTALAYIASHDLHELPLGRTELKGDQVYINVMEAKAGPPEEKGYEFHKRYMDLQIDLEGTETIRIGDGTDLTVTGYAPETDFGTAVCPDLVSCRMGPGNFILCMTGEPHMPGIQTGEDLSLKKCVFKILA